jgi:hypothetical protein
MNYTDFQVTFGIKDEQYANYHSVLLGLIQELYTTYGIALTKDIKSVTYALNSEYNIANELPYNNIQSVSITNSVQGIDYTFDGNSITILPSGNLLSNTDITVHIKYYEFLNQSDTFTKEIWMDTSLIYATNVNPYTLLSVSYDGAILVEDIDYFHYNGQIELATARTNLRRPLVLNMQVGWTEPPYDLKRAFYELAQIRVDYQSSKAYLISRVEDTKGSITTYRENPTPVHIKNILRNYSPLGIIDVI